MAKSTADPGALDMAAHDDPGHPITSLARFLADTASSLAGALILFFVIVSSSAPILMIGLIEGVGSLSKLVLESIPDPFNQKNIRLRIASISYAVGALISVLLFQMISPIFAILGRFFIKLGDDERSDKFLGSSADKGGKLMPVIPFISGSGSIGLVMGPFLLLLLFAYLLSVQPTASSDMFQQIFSIALALGVLSLLLILLMRVFIPNSKQKASGETPVPIISLKPLLSSKETRIIFLITMLLLLASFSPFFFIYRIYIASGLILASLGFLAFVIARYAFSPGIALMSLRLGSKKLLVSSAIFLIIALILAIVFPSSTIIAILSLALWGLSLSILYSAPLSFILLNIKKDESRSALSAFDGASGAIGLPANITAALLWGATIAGSPATFLFSLIVAILALALLV